MHPFVLIMLASEVVALAPAGDPTPPSSPSPAAGAGGVYEVSRFEGVAGLLNLAQGCVRIVAVVSPSAPGADADLDTVLSVVRSNASKRLRAYVILTRASDSDTAARAAQFAKQHPADRAVYLWDGGGQVSAAWKSSVGITDARIGSTYFLYDTAVNFVGVPPSPDAWMTDRRQGEARFDVDRFGRRARELVKRVELKIAAPAPGTP